MAETDQRGHREPDPGAAVAGREDAEDEQQEGELPDQAARREYRTKAMIPPGEMRAGLCARTRRLQSARDEHAGCGDQCVRAVATGSVLFL